MATSVAGLPLTSRVRLKIETFDGIAMEAKPSRKEKERRRPRRLAIKRRRDACGPAGGTPALRSVLRLLHRRGRGGGRHGGGGRGRRREVRRVEHRLGGVLERVDRLLQLLGLHVLLERGLHGL